MGSAAGYQCEACGYEFEAAEDFSFGMSGEVGTPVVCPTHGVGSADTGVNMMRGEEVTPEIAQRTQFPCPECGKEAPRWDRQTCPNCGGKWLPAGEEVLLE